jgi:ribosomal protein S18 acetylase RimI-like enzyme
MAEPTADGVAGGREPAGSSRPAEARSIVPADPADRDVAAETLALAFQDDPVFCWMLPDAERRRARLPRLFALLFEAETTQGRILKSARGEAISFWRPPGKAGTPAADIVRNAWPLARIFGLGVGRALAVSNVIEAHFPKDTPFWYAHFVAVRPDAQGHGWGAALVRAGIALAEAADMPIYLETARPENVGFYQGRGFAVTAEWTIPKGPRFWSMVRPPGQAVA